MSFFLNSIWQSLNYVCVVPRNHVYDRILKVAQPGFEIAPADQNFTPGQWWVAIIFIANLVVQGEWFRPAVWHINFVKRHLTFCSVGIFQLKWNWVSWRPTSNKTKGSCCFAAPFFPAEIMEEIFVSQNLLFGDWKLVLSSRYKKLISDLVNWITAIWLI